VFQEVEFYILPDEPILVEGTVDKSKEAVKIKASSITPLSEVKVEKLFHVYLPSDVMNTENLFGLKNFLESQSERDCPIVIHVEDDAFEEEAVITLPEDLSVGEKSIPVFEKTLKELFGSRVRIEV